MTDLSVELINLGKTYASHELFSNLNLLIKPKERFAILGANGSGKSTLLQIISGFIAPSKGSVVFKKSEQVIPEDVRYKEFAIASPYLELIEEFTIDEQIEFQRKFKPFVNDLSTNEIVTLSQLKNITGKPIKSYSSGMKQRLKLSLAILSDCPLLLLDEPCSNLDRSGVNWYQEMIGNFCNHKSILVCSNHQQEEYVFCSGEIQL
jgi:ABC-type multidrug transport system ATPase subunit